MGVDLMDACKKNDLDQLKQLLKSSNHRETINELCPWPGIDGWKVTVLSFSCRHNTLDFVETLLDNGAREDIEDSHGCNAIHRACFSKTDILAIVKLLVERNADNMHRRTKSQRTPSMLVKDNDTLEYLLQKGARVNDVDCDGRTALYWASCRNASTCINTLLKYGADVNLSANNGDTPLHVGTRYANLDVIKALVASPECDINMKNKKGQTALDVARSIFFGTRNYDPIIEYIENINSNPTALLGTRINTMEQSCETLKSVKNRMNENQCKRCDELSKRVLDLDRKMKQMNNYQTQNDTLSEKDRNHIQKLQDEVRKLNEQIQQLTMELHDIKNKPFASVTASFGTNEYNAELLVKAIRRSFDKLIKDINCDDHAPSLFSRLALSQDEYEQIKAALGSKVKMETMLNILLKKKSPAWAPIFLESLKSNQACIKSVEYIIEEYGRPTLATENTIT